MTIVLRDYQKTSLAEIRSAYAAGASAPLLVAPTGSGKTVIFAYIADSAARRGRNVLILVHRKELLKQTSRTLDAFDVEHGLICSGMTFTRAPVQVASIQTLIRRLGRVAWRPDLIVIDEAHHATSTTAWGKILSHYGAKILGVTATPERLDGQGLGYQTGGFFDTLVMGPTVEELVASGHLSQPVVFAPSNINLSGVHTRMGDYRRDELVATVDKPSITGDAVAHYRRYCPEEPALVFCVSVAHAEHMAEAFRRAGIDAASIDGKLDDTTRSQRIADLATGKLKVLSSCEIISEGTDIPVVSAAILLRPTQSLALYLQQVGRALRPHPGKKRALILDHVGNCLRHGLPDDSRDWTLSGRKRSKGKSDQQSLTVRQCESCYYVHRPAPTCPMCGYIYLVRDRQIEQVAGELEQVSQEQIRRLRRDQARARSIEDLREVGRKRGYKPGWADHVWKARLKA